MVTPPTPMRSCWSRALGLVLVFAAACVIDTVPLPEGTPQPESRAGEEPGPGGIAGSSDDESPSADTMVTECDAVVAGGPFPLVYGAMRVSRAGGGGRFVSSCSVGVPAARSAGAEAVGVYTAQQAGTVVVSLSTADTVTYIRTACSPTVSEDDLSCGDDAAEAVAQLLSGQRVFVFIDGPVAEGEASVDVDFAFYPRVALGEGCNTDHQCGTSQYCDGLCIAGP